MTRIGDGFTWKSPRETVPDSCYCESTPNLEELFDADEIIVTSSSNLCLRADQIDGIKVGNKDYDTYERLREYLLNEFYQATT